MHTHTHTYIHARTLLLLSTIIRGFNPFKEAMVRTRESGLHAEPRIEEEEEAEK